MSSIRFRFHKTPADPSSRSNRGFALLITITLLAFLVLLLVSLASLTRVETQVAGNSQQLAQARQNALMALNIALGQLQKFAGPDQRVTGTADLAGDTAGARLADAGNPVNKNSINAVSNGLTTVQAGTRYWTGIWGNSELNAPSVGNGNSYEKTPSPVLLNWMVSGNEAASFKQPNLTLGQITASNGGSSTTAPVYNPSMAVRRKSDGATLNPAIIATDALELSDPSRTPAVLLVGSNTAGTVDISPTETAADRYVAAPLVTVSSDQSAGISGSNPVGHYAYWVGDEGVKARLNLTDSNAAHTASITDELARFRLMSASRSGVEVLTDFSATSYLAWSQSTATTPVLSTVLSLGQTRLLDSAAITPAILGKHVHDLTTQTYGLQADTLNGGLRRDLTAYFSQAALPTWTATNGTTSGTGTPVIPSAYSPNYKGTSYVPRWDVLRDFYHLYNDNQVAGVVSAQAATLSKVGHAPQLLQMRMLVGANATAGQKVKGLFTPLLALGNPYSTPLKLNGLKVQFWLADTYAGETWPRPVDRMSSLAVASDQTFNTGRFMKLLTYEGDTSNGYGSLTGAVTFTLPPIILQPGEAKVFSLNNNYDAAAGTAVPLVADDPINFAGTYHYVYRTSTLDSPASGSGVKYYKLNESDVMTPVVVKILDSSNQTVLRVEGLNVDAGTTNSFGIYKEPNGATNTDRIIVAYNFDLGDPGVSSSLADPALRPYVDFNPRAAVTRLTNSAFIPGAYFRYSPNTGDLATANTLTPSVPPTTFTSNLDPVEWGRHGQSLSPVLYDLPQGSMPVLSMGQLQQANLTADDIAINVGHQPALAVGNSYATPFLTRNLTVQPRTDIYNSRYTGAPAYSTTRNYYDISYLLNTALWDGYFFSGVPPTGGTYTSVNPRLELTADTTAAQARDGTQAAVHTLIRGAFNINSTSVDAWTALLAGMRALPALPSAGATANTKTAVFPRSIRQPADATTPGGATTAVAPTGDNADSYSGFRRLTDDQIRTLAQAIVKQVRLRGPFVSLSHFVNRALVPAASDPSGLGFSGALQSAIDSTTINDFSNVTTTADKLVIPASPATHTYYADTPAANFALNAPRAPQRSTGIPGWLTQADILQAVGAVFASRSDTFLIRTYGDVQNPATGTVVGRAWCEAVVQRIPDYVDSGTGVKAPETAPSATNATNQTFGRRFRVVSFRWLSPSDI